MKIKEIIQLNEENKIAVSELKKIVSATKNLLNDWESWSAWDFRHFDGIKGDEDVPVGSPAISFDDGEGGAYCNMEVVFDGQTFWVLERNENPKHYTVTKFDKKELNKVITFVKEAISNNESR